MQSPSSPAPEGEITFEKCLKPFPSANKIHAIGSRPDIRVPIRAVQLHQTRDFDGTLTDNEPMLLYDSEATGAEIYHQA